MKKFFLVLFTVQIFGSHIFSQNLKKVEILNEPHKKKRDLPLNKQNKVSVSSFVESFESTTFPPAGWENLPFDGGNGWSRQTEGSPIPNWTSGTISTPPGGGNAVAYCTLNFGTTYNDQSLITTVVEDIQMTDTLFFWMRNQVARSDTIELYFYNDTTSEYLGSVRYPDASGNFNTDWQRWYVPLADRIQTDTNSISGYFEFYEYVDDNTVNGGAISLDLVEVKGIEIISDIPSVTTNGATNITPNSATLNGIVNPNGTSTTVYFSYGITTGYGMDITAKESPVTGSSDVSVSADITGLQANTTYHFECYGDNNTWLSSGGDITFTTSESVSSPLVTTANATNITTNSATLNGTVNPNGSSTTYGFEYGTTLGYGDTVTSSTELNSSEDVDVNILISELTPNTLYNFRIFATNESGTSYGNNESFTTTATAAPEADLEWRSLSLSEFDWKIGSSISADLKVFNNGTSTAPSHSTQLYLSTNTTIDQTDTPLGSQLSYGEILAGDSSVINTSFTVPQVNLGIYYVGAIVDVNNNVAETNEDNNNHYRKGKVIIGYPENFTINTNLTFNNPAESASYEMIGFPGDVNIPLSEVFTGKEGEDWIAYYDNGNNTDYLIEYDGTSTFNFSPGKGFWILSKNEAAVDQNISSVKLESNLVSTGTFELGFPIQLHSGWNIISNPYEINVDWNLVKTYNGISESVHSFSGSYSESTTLEPYKAYYFYNATNLISLLIPYIIDGTVSKYNNIDVNNNKNISISLLDNNKIKSTVSIGFDDNSVIGYDKLDRFIPPGDFEKYRISIFNEKLETEYKYLLKDFRKNNSEQVYKLSVKVPIYNFYKLNFDVADKVEGALVYLIDQNNIFHNLDNKNEISLKSFTGVDNLTLLIGNESFINDQKDKFLPKEFALFQNYPNPFNPATSINYSLPDDVFVTLIVYDILGRKIITLENSFKNAGNYVSTFDAGNLTSGIYFYKLKAGRFTAAKKMLLLK